MIKLNIKDVESKLSKKIRKNTVSLGFDVAERYTGICILKTTETEIFIESLEKIETNPKDDIKNRMSYFISAIEKFKQDLTKYKDYRMVIIEDSWLGLNVYAMKSLVRFSTILWEKFYKECDYIEFIMPNSARSHIGFNKNKQLENTKISTGKFSKGKNKGKNKPIDVKKLVQEYIEQTFGIKIEDNDHADAFVLALSGLLK